MHFHWFNDAGKLWLFNPKFLLSLCHGYKLIIKKKTLSKCITCYKKNMRIYILYAKMFWVTYENKNVVYSNIDLMMLAQLFKARLLNEFVSSQNVNCSSKYSI